MIHLISNAIVAILSIFVNKSNCMEWAHFDGKMRVKEKYDKIMKKEEIQKEEEEE